MSRSLPVLYMSLLENGAKLYDHGDDHRLDRGAPTCVEDGLADIREPALRYYLIALGETWGRLRARHESCLLCVCFVNHEKSDWFLYASFRSNATFIWYIPQSAVKLKNSYTPAFGRNVFSIFW